MSEAALAKLAAQSRGRRRVADPRTSVIHVRCTPANFASYTSAAAQAGMSVGAWFRTLADGTPGPRAVRRPPVEKAELARLLGEIGKIGSNVNQMARVLNTTGDPPEGSDLALARTAIEDMRAAVMKALGRGD